LEAAAVPPRKSIERGTFWRDSDWLQNAISSSASSCPVEIPPSAAPPPLLLAEVRIGHAEHRGIGDSWDG
jgi:hypothetical protein